MRVALVSLTRWFVLSCGRCILLLLCIKAYRNGAWSLRVFASYFLPLLTSSFRATSRTLSNPHNTSRNLPTRGQPTSRLTSSDSRVNNTVRLYCTAMMDHTKMDHQMPKTMAEMPMTFFTSTTTPLYTSAWTPKTAAQYAMTCLFLVLLCIVFRGLLAARCNMPWLLAYTSPRKDTPEESSCCAEVDGLQKPIHGESGPGKANRDQDGPNRVWEILLRALLDTSLAIVSYML